MARSRRRGASIALLLIAVLAAGACGTKPKPAATTTTTSPPATHGTCGTLKLGYDPTVGYEASAYLVGELARMELGCTVRYVKTNSRAAWQLAANGSIDAYLDDYGNIDLHGQYARPGGPVTVVGDNGVRGNVDLVVPEFMEDRGVRRARDLLNLERVGWGVTTPAITTVPALAPLARALNRAVNLNYSIIVSRPARNGIHGLKELYGRWQRDDQQQTPAVYLVQGPVNLVTGSFVELPTSASTSCVRNAVTSLCRFGEFSYYKIANADFADSGSPAYRLVYSYHLGPPDVETISKIIALSGNDVQRSDMIGWINTHRSVWRRWLSG
jgi:glycine betaine/proline transport system substrate-binding protein